MKARIKRWSSNGLQAGSVRNVVLVVTCAIAIAVLALFIVTPAGETGQSSAAHPDVSSSVDSDQGDRKGYSQVPSPTGTPEEHIEAF